MKDKKPKKNKRAWGATGFFPPIKFALEQEDKTVLLNEIKDKKPNTQVPDSFFRKIEEAIIRCKGQIEVAKKSSPGKVRSNLSAFAKSYEKLVKTYNNLDGNSLQLIAEANNNKLEIRSSIMQGHNIVQQAKELANEYQSAGNLQKHHLNILAFETYTAIEDELKIKPSQTKSGLFEVLLTIVISLATNKRRSTAHSLTASYLKTIKSDNNGAITWEVNNS